MKRILFWMLLFALSFAPLTAHAQSTITFESMFVQLWPEYDRADMLVLIDFKLSGTGETPQQVTLQLPANAEIYAVAREMDGSLVVEPYEAGNAADATTLTLNTIPGVAYRVEYYAPLTRENDTRRYTWTWAGAYAINNLQVSLLLPPNATNLQSEPALQEMMQPDGSTLYGQSFGPLQPGDAVSLSLSYVKPDNSLTVSQQGAQPVPTQASVPPSTSSQVRDLLPYLLVGLGVILLVVGGYFYLRPDPETGPAPKNSGKRKAGKKNKAQSEKVRYCPECGHRAEAGDKFCRSCGSRLR